MVPQTYHKKTHTLARTVGKRQRSRPCCLPQIQSFCTTTFTSSFLGSNHLFIPSAASLPFLSVLPNLSHAVVGPLGRTPTNSSPTFHAANAQRFAALSSSSHAATPLAHITSPTSCTHRCMLAHKPLNSHPSAPRHALVWRPRKTLSSRHAALPRALTHTPLNKRFVVTHAHALVMHTHTLAKHWTRASNTSFRASVGDDDRRNLHFVESLFLASAHETSNQRVLPSRVREPAC
jgi:hypothetical protein